MVEILAQMGGRRKPTANIMSQSATMYIDGASRGNPGPAAYAVVLTRPGQTVIEEADTIGTTTNNIAEYTALVEGLRLAAEFGVTHLQIYSDSELMVKQMNGQYKVKHFDLRPLYEEAQRRKEQFTSVTITHVRREQNKRADAIGNEALDGKPRKRGTIAEESTTPSASTHGKSERAVDPTESLPGQGIANGPLPPQPQANVTDVAIRADAVQCLRDAAKHWAANGMSGLPPEAVWDQLWSLLAEAGVLKKKKT
jgi:ribonuclease HI